MSELYGAEPRARLAGAGLGWEAGGRWIVRGLDVALGAGELVGVIGPNGAGKTTLLRLLGGLIAPSEGTVRLDDVALADLSPRLRAQRLAFMSQETGQSFPFTVQEILMMGRYPHLGRFEQETPDDREKARQMLSYVGLGGLETRLFGELSGGERQLVLFAKALVQDTHVLLLDEPSSSLDIRHQDRIFSMALELAREGRAVAASVHNLGVAAHYCTRLILMDRGGIAAAGRPDEVLRPALLDPIYGIRTVVTPSLATGSLTVAVVPWKESGSGTRVHLIGGAGSAVNLTRELFRLGYRLTGGIAHEHDSDEKLWQSLRIENNRVGAFSRISDQDVEDAARLVQAADLTILCHFPVGQGNLGNLKLAARARRLVVMAAAAEEAPRTFFASEGRELFEALRAGAQVMSYGEIIMELERGRAPGRATDRASRGNPLP
jgi:iron complex transport system ATP-binding protein